MNAPEHIQQLLTNALRRLIASRLELGRFSDEAEVKESRFYFSTLEGLECLLIPLVHLPKAHYWDALKEEFPQLENAIVDDINYIINSNIGHKNPPDEHGKPYFGSKRRTYWTSECASFTLSVLTNFLEFRNRFGIKSTTPSAKTVWTTLQLQLGWLELCRRNNSGWAWIPDVKASAHPWPTWSVLDTFEEVLRARGLKTKDRKRLKTRCENIAANLANQFEAGGKGVARRWEKLVLKPVEQGHAYDADTALDLTRLMLAVALHRGESDILPLAEKLFRWASKAKFEHVQYKYHLREETDYIEDSSLVPSVLRALIIMGSKLKGNATERLDQALGSSHDLVITRLFRKLQQSLIKDGPFTGLWGVRENGSIVYELYFTERSIEAITECLLCSYPKGISNLEIPKPTDSTATKLPAVVVSRVDGRSAPTNDIDRYTTWIPQLAAGDIPSDLRRFNDWKVDDLLEYYVFRLLNNALMFNGDEWGYRKRGQALPDGQLHIPHDEDIALYDAKACRNGYALTRDELRKFKEYIDEAQRLRVGQRAQVKFFIVITSEFSSELENRRIEIQESSGTALVCMRANDLCWFSDQVRKVTTNSTDIRLIRWARLFSMATPILKREHFEKVLNDWKANLAK